MIFPSPYLPEETEQNCGKLCWKSSSSSLQLFRENTELLLILGTVAKYILFYWERLSWGAICQQLYARQ